MLNRAQAASMGSHPLTDVQLQGTATSYAGSTTHSGSVTLLADSQGRSKATYSFENGTRTEYSNRHAERPECEWTGEDGKTHQTAAHNCWTPGDWFLPSLSYSGAISGKDLIYRHLGREKVRPAAIQGGTAREVEHLRLKRNVAGKSPAMTKMNQELSAAELFLNSTTLLPSSLEFNIHPDNDLRSNIPVEIQYSDYHEVDGIKCPFHIQRFLNHGLQLDITISSATINAGTPIQKQ